MNVEHEIDVLKRQVMSLRRQAQRHEEYIDTVSSPLFKRLLFVLQGYRWNRLGTWYDAAWNRPGQHLNGH